MVATPTSSIQMPSRRHAHTTMEHDDGFYKRPQFHSRRDGIDYDNRCTSGHLTMAAIRPYRVSIGFACSRRPMLHLPRYPHPASTTIKKSTRNAPISIHGHGNFGSSSCVRQDPLTVPSFVNLSSRNSHSPTGPPPARQPPLRSHSLFAEFYSCFDLDARMRKDCVVYLKMCSKA